ncbi:uncharacterized protein EDB93DRAFT_938903 [Suillus bovinus]|uniref:uncharacterized protein n=1 Tax=Suillus bovinus TaxID=48563 RepID=UPI001B86B4BF|nr:uncharacterized protein EDB93DRAFT_938903 [Suillus bovinus]KAG2131437.1 hypothetical protein EDB93DRAFT_938903 [Suillus bovinus]
MFLQNIFECPILTLLHLQLHFCIMGTMIVLTCGWISIYSRTQVPTELLIYDTSLIHMGVCTPRTLAVAFDISTLHLRTISPSVDESSILALKGHTYPTHNFAIIVIIGSLSFFMLRARTNDNPRQ